MAIITRTPWASQPQFPAQIDWGNDLTDGLIKAFNSAALPAGTRVGTTSFTPTPLGVAAVASGSSLYSDSIPALGSAGTIVGLCNVKYTPGISGFTFSCGTSGAGSQLFAFQSCNDVQAARAVLRCVDAGGISTAEASTALPTATDIPAYSLYAVTYNGTAASLTIWKDGIDITTGLANTAASGAMSSIDNFAINGVNRGADNFAPSGQAAIVAYCWNRALTQQELLKLTRQPFQIFAPLQRRFISLGSTGTTGTLATTNANDTLAASGSAVGFTGTLAKTNANDTLAGSGTQTNTGTLAKANVNDSLAASGYIQANGTLATTNTSDALSASGTAAGGNAGWLGPGPRAYDFLNPRRKNIELSPDPIEVVAKSIATGIVERAARKERDEGAYLAKVRAELDAHKIEIDRRELKKLRKQIKQRDDDETLTTLLMSMI